MAANPQRQTQTHGEHTPISFNHPNITPLIQTHGSKPTLHLYTWVFGGTNVRDNNIVVDGDDDEEEEEDVVVIDVGLGQAPLGHNPDPLCVSPVDTFVCRMNRREWQQWGDDDSTGNAVQDFVDEIAGGNRRWR